MIKRKRLRIAFAGWLAVVVVIALASCQRADGHRSVPLFTMQQTDSTHVGYRRTTLTSGSTVYESDYSEAPLLSVNTAASQIVGELDNGDGAEKAELYAIPNQDPKNYVILAGDMYPLGIFRNTKTPPFDWRTAKFKQIEFAAQEGPAAHKRSSDPALIQEVLQVLKGGGKATTIPVNSAASQKNFTGLYLWSDQLPGMIYCPHVYFDTSGQIYLGFWNPNSPEWSVAGPLFSAWVKTR